jgi:archaeosine-15-forming tRNA-guanine transglycosylase
MTIVLFTLMITFLSSTYMMTYSHKLYLLTDRVLKKMKVRDVEMKEEEGGEGEAHRPILFLGFYKIASHLLQAVEKLNPSIKDKIEVIDFNPEVHRKLSRHGIRCDFGDLGNTGTLKECGLETAKVVVSTIPDTILKGTSNLALLNYTKRVNPKARVVVTAESMEAAKKLWTAGADFVILPHFEAAEKTATLLEKLLTEESIPDACSEYRCRVMEDEGEIIG